MRIVLQRVKRASVKVEGEVVGAIDNGLLVLLGVRGDDSPEDVSYLIDKIINLRIFTDADDKMNLSLADVKGNLLVVSQFTLYGDVRRGRRPSWAEAAPPEKANELYESFVTQARIAVEAFGGKIETGVFGAKMQVELVNDGPVTLLIDSQKLF